MNTEVSRADHLKWCKQRAIKYCDRGEPQEAAASFISDMLKHGETANHAAIPLMFQLMMIGSLKTSGDMRKFIEGFN